MSPFLSTERPDRLSIYGMRLTLHHFLIRKFILCTFLPSDSLFIVGLIAERSIVCASLAHDSLFIHRFHCKDSLTVHPWHVTPSSSLSIIGKIR